MASKPSVLAPRRATPASRRSCTRSAALIVRASKNDHNQQSQKENAARQPAQSSRRELMLNSTGMFTLGALLNIGAAPRPNTVGLQEFNGVKTLGLCPPNPNCISTAEEMNDPAHYVPQWTYNPEEGRGKKKAISQKEAMEELKEVVESIRPDKYTPKVVKQTDDYLYAEFESPTFGFIDDVEFYFPGGKRDLVEYRSASRIGDSDFDINRKRIKAIREALQKKGWKSIGY